MQKVLREGPHLLRRFAQPLQHRIRIDLEPPRRASDTPAFGQAGDDPHDEVDSGALAVKDRAEGLQKRAATGDAQQVSPGTPTGMAIGAEIAPADSAPIGTVRVRAKMGRGVHLAAAAARHDDARGRS